MLYKNPLMPSRREEFNHEGLLIDWLVENYPNGFEGGLRTFLNGDEIAVEDLDVFVGEGDTVVLLVMPQGLEIGAIALNILLSVAVSYAVTAVFGVKPKTPSFAEPPEANTVYSINAQQNAAKIGQPIPVIYGNVVTTPDFAAQPYNTYDEVHMTGNSVDINNAEINKGDGDQYLFYLLALGQGEHIIDDVLLGDTPVSQLSSGSVEWVHQTQKLHNNQQGSLKTALNAQIKSGTKMIGENVISAIEVGGQELKDATTTDYFGVGKYPVERIAVDIAFNRGLYKMATDGKFQNIAVEFEILAKNSSGTVITKKVKFESSLNNVSPIRRTIIFSVPKDTYSVALKRITGNTSGSRTQGDFSWMGLKGVATPVTTPVYSNAHIIAIRIKATDFISSTASSRVRVKLGRKLPGIFDNDVRSNNPIDAVYDIMTDDIYGSNRPRNELDMSLMKKLHKHWGGAITNTGFNAVFNGKSTVYEALSSALQPVAAEAIALGSWVSVAYDGVKPIRVQLYNDANILKDSLQFNYNFDKVGMNDGYQVGYRDPDTWQEEFETVPASATDPRVVTLFGCNNDQHAKEFAQLLYNRYSHQRKSVVFETELEGAIPKTGDRIGISTLLGNWGTSGLVYNWDAANLTLEVLEDISFTGNDYVVLRDEYGAPTTPISVTRGPTSRSMVLASAPPITVFQTGEGRMQTTYSFGEASVFVRDFVVSSVTHIGGVTFKIEGNVYDEKVYNNSMSYLTSAVV